MRRSIIHQSLAIAVGVIVWRARVHWKGKNRIGVKIAVVFWILTVGKRVLRTDTNRQPIDILQHSRRDRYYNSQGIFDHHRG
jgi:hypothetical protein